MNVLYEGLLQNAGVHPPGCGVQPPPQHSQVLWNGARRGTCLQAGKVREAAKKIKVLFLLARPLRPLYFTFKYIEKKKTHVVFQENTSQEIKSIFFVRPWGTENCVVYVPICMLNSKLSQLQLQPKEKFLFLSRYFNKMVAQFALSSYVADLFVWRHI